MSTQVEYSSPLFRDRGYKETEVRASGRFSAEEVRSLLGKLGLKDIRQIGAPDDLFDRLLANRAERAGIAPGDSDLQVKITAARPF